MTEENPTCIVLLSGGIDSAVCAFLAKEKYTAVHCLHFDYGQRNAAKESACSKKIATQIGASYHEIKMPWYSLLNGSSSVINNQIIPDSKLSKDHLPNTIVPFRNGTMLSIATAFADAWDIDAIYIGATYADESGYPDCRPEFFWAMQNVLFNGSSKAHPILEVPLGDMDKSDVINLGKRLKVPFKDTWSCYSRSDDPCGNCLACNVRKEGFKDIGMADPIFS